VQAQLLVRARAARADRGVGIPGVARRADRLRGPRPPPSARRRLEKDLDRSRQSCYFSNNQGNACFCKEHVEGFDGTCYRKYSSCFECRASADPADAATIGRITSSLRKRFVDGRDKPAPGVCRALDELRAVIDKVQGARAPPPLATAAAGAAPRPASAGSAQKRARAVVVEVQPKVPQANDATSDDTTCVEASHHGATGPPVRSAEHSPVQVSPARAAEAEAPPPAPAMPAALNMDAEELWYEPDKLRCISVEPPEPCEESAQAGPQGAAEVVFRSLELLHLDGSDMSAAETSVDGAGAEEEALFEELAQLREVIERIRA